jgi:hypothetical protein
MKGASKTAPKSRQLAGRTQTLQPEGGRQLARWMCHHATPHHATGPRPGQAPRQRVQPNDPLVGCLIGWDRHDARWRKREPSKLPASAVESHRWIVVIHSLGAGRPPLPTRPPHHSTRGGEGRVPPIRPLHWLDETARESSGDGGDASSCARDATDVIGELEAVARTS